jgi:hypothetical protein
MAKILVLSHEYDLYEHRHFLVQELCAHWVTSGHEVIVHQGASRAPRADVAILHVDATVVGPEYLEALADTPVIVNRATVDISKRAYSQNLVGPFDAYAGPVIVKTNANSGGIPEWLHESVARERGVPASGPPSRHMTGKYPIFPSLARVPAQLRMDPGLVIEKFLPERDPRGYVCRHYLFFGTRERCSRVVGPHPVVKGAAVFERTLVEVPDEIRAWRRKLGFDYGKLDFVIHDGKPVLIDANRTPTLPKGQVSAAILEGLDVLAEGIDAFLR